MKLVGVMLIMNPEYYMPQNWRLRAEDKKQGSSNETIEYDILIQ